MTGPLGALQLKKIPGSILKKEKELLPVSSLFFVVIFPTLFGDSEGSL